MNEPQIAKMQRMLEITRELTTTTSLEQLLHRIVWIAVELTETNNAGILLFDPDTDDLRFTVVSHFADKLLDIPVPIDGSIAGAAFASGEVVIVPDAQSDPRYYRAVEDEIGLAARSLLAVPLQYRERRIGVLEVENKIDDSPFSDRDVTVLTTLAAQATIAIESARLIESLEQHVIEREQALATALEQKNQLGALYQASVALTSTLYYEQVLDRILEQVAVVVAYDAANVMLVQGDEARVFRTRGYERFEAAEIATSISFLISAVPGLLEMQRTLQPLTIPDVTEEDAWVYSRPEHHWIASYVGVPIHLRGRLLGFLNVLSATPGFYSEIGAARLQALAHQAAVAIENAQLYQQAQRDIEERERAQKELQEHRDHLEELVAARTIDLERAVFQTQQLNVQLEQGIVEREQLIADLKAFAHTVAHDLKNPLSIMIGYASLLLDALTQQQAREQAYLAELLIHSGFKMGHIIDELLTLTSVQHAQITPEPLEMAVIVAEAEQRLASAIAQTEIQIIKPERWPVVLGNPTWVEQVWINYISNAIKYGGSPPRVELGYSKLEAGSSILETEESASSIQHPVSSIQFWVRDNGPGIAPEAQARLFTPFTRLDKARAEGHGLGLSIVKRVVEKMGGEVGVDSAPGRGSLFFFTLPVAADDPLPPGSD